MVLLAGFEPAKHNVVEAHGLEPWTLLQRLTYYCTQVIILVGLEGTDPSSVD